MNTTANIEGELIESVMRALRQLSPGSQGAVEALVRQLAEREGISVEPAAAPPLRNLGKTAPDTSPNRVSSGLTRPLL